MYSVSDCVGFVYEGDHTLYYVCVNISLYVYKAIMSSFNVEPRCIMYIVCVKISSTADGIQNLNLHFPVF